MSVQAWIRDVKPREVSLYDYKVDVRLVAEERTTRALGWHRLGKKKVTISSRGTNGSHRVSRKGQREKGKGKSAYPLEEPRENVVVGLQLPKKDAVRL